LCRNVKLKEVSAMAAEISLIGLERMMMGMEMTDIF
jgi:hypothetical protein